MTNIKKALFMVAIGLVTATAVTVVATKESSILENTFAGGTTIDGDNRTTTFDKDTDVIVDGSTRTFTEGNIGAYSPDCSSLANGVGTLRDLYLYCSTAGLDANNRFYGFGGSTISSISMAINTNGHSMSITSKWCRLSENHTCDDSSTSSSVSATSSNEQQTLTWEGKISFIVYPQDTYPCVHIYTSSSYSFDIISLTIQYACK